MHTHPHLLGAEAAHRRRELQAAAARARPAAGAETPSGVPAAVAPLLADRRLHALAALLALLAGLLLGAGEAAAIPRGPS